LIASDKTQICDIFVTSFFFIPECSVWNKKDETARET